MQQLIAAAIVAVALWVVITAAGMASLIYAGHGCTVVWGC